MINTADDQEGERRMEGLSFIENGKIVAGVSVYKRAKRGILG